MPSLSLALICKNEVNNFPQLLESVRGCFDTIYVTDTGSTDGTLELLEKYKTGNPADTELQLSSFKWINDFSAARNFSFEQAKTDYIMWLDLDDVLENRESFISWRNQIMPVADYWLANYHYASDVNGKPACTFVRERVIKNGLGLKWRYFVHEGIMPIGKKGQAKASFTNSWSVIHKRTQEDQLADRQRNLRLFEGRELDARMLYYYGKELFENQKPLEAYAKIKEALKEPTLELHDKILAYQYCSFAAVHLNQYEEGINLAKKGSDLSTNRAEFYNLIGDCYIKQQKFWDAVPFYSAAKSCNPDVALQQVNGAIFVNHDMYRHYPRHQLARIYVWANQLPQAKALLEEATQCGPNIETVQLMAEIEKLESTILAPNFSAAKPVDEYVISCLPTGLYEWDDSTLSKQGIGGSETAAIHMARELHKQSGKTVRIFNQRNEKAEFKGVVYEPFQAMQQYMLEKKPLANIAWRHNVKITDAPSYVWSHDLGFPGIEQRQNYEKVLALSNFHKHWLTHMYGVPEDKIKVTRNGFITERFVHTDLICKKPGKIVWGSSPDRGLDRALLIMDRVVEAYPHTELHVYYGFDNMLKLGKKDEVSSLEAMIKNRPYVFMHGATPQSQLTREYQEAEVWLYPTNFLETYCITAIEMLACRVYPVVRRFGALPDTLMGHHATLLDRDCEGEEDIQAYADAVISALKNRSWASNNFSATELNKLSWASVAKSWLEFLPLSH